MRLVFIGPQGSGKGTRAKIISEKYGIPHLSMGDLLREYARDDSNEDVETIRHALKNGLLVSVDLTLMIIEKRVEEIDCKEGFILDGFPRSLSQAEGLDKIMKIDHVFYLELSDEEAIRRIGGRKTCRKCGEIYGEANLAKGENCHKCGGELYVRDDDTEEIIKKRLEIFHKETDPIVNFYKRLGIVHKIDSGEGVESNIKDMTRILEG